MKPGAPPFRELCERMGYRALRTSFCGNLTYSTLDEIQELPRRLKISMDQGEEFESGIRRWSLRES